MTSDLLQKCQDVVEDLTNSAQDNFGDLSGLKPVMDPKLLTLLEVGLMENKRDGRRNCS